jgi:general stress protein 26
VCSGSSPLVLSHRTVDDRREKRGVSMPLPTTPADVWNVIERWPFAVLGFVTPGGEARAAGVMYTVRNRVLYVVTGPDTWKVRHIRANPNVSVTVTVQRLPIRVRKVPPAVISFSGTATIVPLNELGDDLRTALTHGIDTPAHEMCAIRIEPAGRFVTYGIGVSPWSMRRPDEALARVPTG